MSGSRKAILSPTKFDQNQEFPDSVSYEEEHRSYDEEEGKK